jgi:predicted CoA-binding protein
MRTPSEILVQARTIAVVGASDDPAKAAHRIPARLRDLGWRILPVNPNDPEVLGIPSVASVADLPDGVDVVEVFRPSEEAADIVCEVVARGIPAVWLQQGISSAEARAVAEEAGIDYVEDQCMGHLALAEGLHPVV